MALSSAFLLLSHVPLALPFAIILTPPCPFNTHPTFHLFSYTYSLINPNFNPLLHRQSHIHFHFPPVASLSFPYYLSPIPLYCLAPYLIHAFLIPAFPIHLSFPNTDDLPSSSSFAYLLPLYPLILTCFSWFFIFPLFPHAPSLPYSFYKSPLIPPPLLSLLFHNDLSKWKILEKRALTVHTGMWNRHLKILFRYLFCIIHTMIIKSA